MTEHGRLVGNQEPWVFPAAPKRVVDGDTLDVWTDLGFSTYRLIRVRLLGLNTPELHDKDDAVRAEAQAAKAFVEQWVGTLTDGIPSRWPLLLESHKPDAFGRALGVIWRESDGASLNEAIIDWLAQQNR